MEPDDGIAIAGMKWRSSKRKKTLVHTTERDAALIRGMKRRLIATQTASTAPSQMAESSALEAAAEMRGRSYTREVTAVYPLFRLQCPVVRMLLLRFRTRRFRIPRSRTRKRSSLSGA